jgi:hypothetical protein
MKTTTVLAPASCSVISHSGWAFLLLKECV